jgi:hypothetical protein
MSDCPILDNDVSGEGVFAQVVFAQDLLQRLRGLHFARAAVGEMDGKKLSRHNGSGKRKGNDRQREE